MLTFSYVARDPATGQKVKAEVQADNEQLAAKLIREQGLAPLQVELKGSGGLGRLTNFVNRVKAPDRVLFSRQLATLINAGLPLVQSLRTVGNQTKNKPLKIVINQVIADVEAGTALSAALG